MGRPPQGPARCYLTERCTWFSCSLDGSPLPFVYAFQPLLGSQMRRNQMT
jgi:hypothetical protein